MRDEFNGAVRFVIQDLENFRFSIEITILPFFKKNEFFSGFTDCVLHIAWKTYTRYDVYGKCDCVVIARENYMHGIMYIGRSGMLRLGTITLGVRKMK